MFNKTFGFYTAVSTVILAIVTFSIAVLTPPLSGPYCRGGCFEYPFTDIASRFPRDYIWMYPAMMMILVYLVLMVCIHYYAPKEKKVYSHVGLLMALMSVAILVTDYFLQVSVVQPSLLKGETEGIALLSQFNAHGIFIVLEELGYFLMSIGFLFMAPVFTGSKLAKSIRWVFILSFVLTLAAFIFYSITFGINREYLFEVAAISINWLALIVGGILLSIQFRKAEVDFSRYE